MLFILIASASIIVVAALGLSVCRLAALSDRNNALDLAEWLATSLGEPQVVPTDRAGEQSLFDPPNEAFRAAG
jgi:Tfp pilus assembly protein PilX